MTRAERDFYPTPATAVYPLLKRVGRDMRRFGGDDFYLEPAAGDGAIMHAFKDFREKNNDGFQYPSPRWDAVDIHDYWLSNPEGMRLDTFYNQSYLTFIPERQYDVIITNPPFQLAQEFVEHSLAFETYPTVIMLLRLGFLGSDKRSAWWQGREPDAIYVLSQRPKFTGTGSDNADYGWFFWNWCEKGIFILEPWEE